MVQSTKLCLCTILVLTSTFAWSQGFVENALLFSRTKHGGSARIQAMGGAQIALGGDYSSALSNPAGLGMFNRSEITFTPGINFYDINSRHLGTSQEDSKTKLTIPGISLVYHYPQERGKFLGGSFGASLTRLNDFNQTFRYSGNDDASSIIDYFEDRAQGYSINSVPGYSNIPLLNFDFPEGLAYLTYLITPLNEEPGNTDPVAPDDYINYWSELDPLDGEVRTLQRNETVRTSGSQYQWSFAYGGNLNDKFFFGGSVGITSLRYTFSRTYGEGNYTFSEDPSYNPLNSLELEEDITIDGSGVNLTLGIIYRPIDQVQIGLSYVTPTYYQVSDIYDATITTRWNNSRGVISESSLEPIVSEYNLRTPGKLSTGVAVFIGSYGFITGDVEWINYGNANYDSDIDGISFNPENDDINYYYTNTLNYRVGGEFRYNIFRLRGGFNMMNTPYKEKFDIDRKVKTVTAGAGVRLQQFYVDAAWLRSSGNTSYSPYVLQNGTGPVVNQRQRLTTMMITVGYFF